MQHVASSHAAETTHWRLLMPQELQGKDRKLAKPFYSPTMCSKSATG